MTIVLNATSGITTPPVSVEGSTSGTITFVAPAVAGTNTQTLVAATDTLAPIVRGTAVASTSGTSIDFTGIPSWVKRVTVMFNGVSTNGTDTVLVQIGAGSITSSGYTFYGAYAGGSNQAAGTNSTTGIIFDGGLSGNASSLRQGTLTFVNITGNTWTYFLNGALFNSTSYFATMGAGSIALGGSLDRVRITTNGSDTFDAGSINILYE